MLRRRPLEEKRPGHCPAPDITLFVWRGLLFPLLPYLCLAILICFLQVVARQRYLGMLLFAGFLATIIASRDLLGIEHPLFSFVFPAVGAPLSDMNGSVGLAALANWLRVYWLALAGLMLVGTYLLYPRGIMMPRGLMLRRSLGNRRAVVPVIALAAVAIGAAGIIQYNVAALNTYVTRADTDALRAAYERAFRPAAELPMPRITAVQLELDLFPEQPGFSARAVHTLENRTAAALDRIDVVFPPGAELVNVELDGAKLREHDRTLADYLVYELDPPLPAGAQLTLRYELKAGKNGFRHARPDTRLVANGTFLVNDHFAPTIGFNPDYMIEDNDDRQKHGLPPLPRRADLDDHAARRNHAGRHDSDFIALETTISVPREQTAVSLGQLEAQWEVGERRFFRYRAKPQVRNFYPVLAARYETAREAWGDVDIEILHHGGHDWNIERMAAAVKDSLAHYERTFGPYPFGDVRIVEFPAYRAFAQAFAGTIAFSEDLGFLADVQPDDLDMPYYVVAHEMAHMWWGHIVVAADVQGDGFIHETLAQYSALRVMEERYGRDRIRPFLARELDAYLAGRAAEPVGEQPLYRVERQSYIHYRKGSLVMYALADIVGRERVDRVLARLVAEYGFNPQAYATSTDFLALLRAELNGDYAILIADLFEKITLFDLKVAGARAEPTGDGHWAVTVDVEAAKLYADESGIETSAPFDWSIDLGLFARSPADADFGSGDVVLVQRMPLRGGPQTLRFVVDQPPAVAGIDPYHKLIDRQTGDNLIEVAISR